MSGEFVLLVDGNMVRRDRLAFAIDEAAPFRVRVAGTLEDARLQLTDPNLTGIICDAGERGEVGPALLNDVRSEPAIASLPFVLMTSPANSAARIEGWSTSADAVVVQPIHPAELLACYAACSRKRARRRGAHATTRQLDVSISQVQRLLVTLLDAVMPGAAFRGAEATAMSVRMADELAVPIAVRADLERAARLHEIGRLVAEPLHPIEPARLSIPVTAAVLTASAVLVEPVPGMNGTAELLAGAAANWDGSGYPSHLERGEIPMRSRILRVAVDYLALMRTPTGSGRPEAVLELMATHSSTYYDPAVLSALALIVSQPNSPPLQVTTEPVRVDRLTEGSMLVDDLCTASGVKLLSAGAILTAASLKLIAERHISDPIVHAVTTRRRGG